MGKTKIEWCDYTLNPVKGLCPVACKDNQGKEYCYARRMYKRFKWNPEIRFEPEVMLDLAKMPDGSKVFVGSTIELFHESFPYVWLDEIFWQVSKHPLITCIFLTKQPQNLPQWSPFPDNCWVGVSATNRERFVSACTYLEHIKARVKYLSLEPLLDWQNGQGVDIKSYLQNAEVNWLIIGQRTPISKATQPEIEWVWKIIEAADKVGVPVFLKDNMMPLLKDCIGIHAPYWRITDPDNIWPYARQVQLRQEFPNVK